MDAASHSNPVPNSSQSFPAVPDAASPSPYDGGRTPSDEGLATAGELTLAGDFTVTNDLLLDHSTGLLGKVDPESNRLVANALQSDPSLQVRLDELRRLVRILRAAIEVFDRRPLCADAITRGETAAELILTSIPDAAACAIRSNAIAGITNADLIDHLRGDTCDAERQRVNVKLVEYPELLGRYRELERLLVVVGQHYEARLPAFGVAQDMALRRTIRDIVRTLPQAVPRVAEDFKLPDLLDHSRGELVAESGEALENAIEQLPALADAMGEMASLASIVRERYQDRTPVVPVERDAAMRDLIRESSRALRAPVDVSDAADDVDAPIAAESSPFGAMMDTPLDGVAITLRADAAHADAAHADDAHADDASGETVTSLDIADEIRREAAQAHTETSSRRRRRALADADTDVLPPRLTVVHRGTHRPASSAETHGAADADESRARFPWSWAAVAAMLLAVAGVQLFLAGPRQAVPNGYAQPSALFEDNTSRNANSDAVADRTNGGAAGALVNGANQAANRGPSANLANGAAVDRPNTAGNEPLTMPSLPDAAHQIGDSSVYQLLTGGQPIGPERDVMVDRNSANGSANGNGDGDGLHIDPTQLTPMPDATADPVMETMGVAGFLAGDINSDGQLGVSDNMLLLRAILDGTTDQLGPAADVNGDKVVDLRDVMVLEHRLKRD